MLGHVAGAALMFDTYCSPMHVTPRALRAGIVLLVATAVLGSAHFVRFARRGWFADLPGGSAAWFDLNEEYSFGAWFSVVVLALVAAAAAIAAMAETGRRRVAWGTLAFLVCLLSIDDKIMVHERLPELFGIERQTMATHEWLLPGLIIGGIGVAVLWYLVQALDRPVKWGLLCGLVVFAFGAIVVEGFTGALTRQLSPEWARAAMPHWVLLEEVLENVGSIIALVTIFNHLDRTGVLAFAPRATDPSTRKDQPPRNEAAL